LRGLCLLLPLPWTKTTIPPGLIRHSQVAVQLDGARVGLHDLAAGRPASGTRDTGVRRGLPQGGTLQAGEDLLVGHLGELGVELPDGEESPGRADADQLVGVGADPGPPPGRRDGHGQHDPGRPLRPGDLAGGPGRGPGRDAVIDHHRHPPIQPLAGPPSPVAGGPGVHCGLLPRLDVRDLIPRYPGLTDDLGAQDPHPVLPDHAHAQLRPEQYPELTHHDDIQRRAKRPGHLERDRDPAARQAQDNDRLALQVPQPDSKPPPGIITIGENHDNPP
jgi:hypothetical protein